jgi:hypothetical protein
VVAAFPKSATNFPFYRVAFTLRSLALFLAIHTFAASISSGVGSNIRIDQFALPEVCQIVRLLSCAHLDMFRINSSGFLVVVNGKL